MTNAGSHNAHPVYRADIDGLRAIAILSVMIFHAFPNALPGGFVGVDVFFVISGYLISSIIFKSLERGNFSFAQFYANRIRRIFPALIVTLAATYVVGWHTQLPDEFQQLSKHIVAGVGFVQNFVLWSESGYFDSAAELKPLLHLWSLAIEEQFYLLYPFLMWVAWKIHGKLLSILLALTVLSFLLNVHGIHTDATQTFFAPYTRFWELLVGALLAHRHAFMQAERESQGLFGQNLISAVGLSLIGVASFALHKDLAFPGWWAVTPVLGTGMVIQAGPQAWGNRALLSFQPLVWVGLISYPLYLWHWPVLSFAHIVEASPPSPAVRAWCVALSFGLAWATYHLLEKPFRSKKKGGPGVAALVLALASIAAVGVAASSMSHGINGGPETVLWKDSPATQTGEPNAPNVRLQACQSDHHQTLCIESGRPTIFLWGDSHAASLYAGLSRLQSIYPSLGVSQSTGCGNPPFIRLGHYTDTTWCSSPEHRLALNQATIHAIGKSRPAIVLLHARWAYEHYHTSPAQTIDKLRETMAEIHEVSPSSKVAVIGPVPNWNSTLAREMHNYWRNSLLHAQPPLYMRSGLVPEISDWDKFLTSEVPKLGVSYLSAYRHLCNADGCLTRVSPKASDLTAIDYGHLSPAGSRYLIDQLAAELFNLLEPDQRP